MKLVVISDTHGKHEELLSPLPDGDVLIHAGDYSVYGKYDETKAFLEWFVNQPHQHKIIVYGNHEVGVCPLQEQKRGRMCEALINTSYNMKVSTEYHRTCDMIQTYADSVKFLVDEALVIDGVKFWGSPWCGGSFMTMGRWGFYLRTDEQRREKFALIPDDTHVLITHSPPLGTLDTAGEKHLGCPELAARVTQVQPPVHIFGHIHNSYGVHFGQHTDSYNCSNLNEAREVVNPITLINVLGDSE